MIGGACGSWCRRQRGLLLAEGMDGRQPCTQVASEISFTSSQVVPEQMQDGELRRTRCALAGELRLMRKCTGSMKDEDKAKWKRLGDCRLVELRLSAL